MEPIPGHKGLNTNGGPRQVVKVKHQQTNKFKKGRSGLQIWGGNQGDTLPILTGENTYLAHQRQQKQYLEKAQVVVTSSKVSDSLSFDKD